jgi:hypothetical protein
MTILMTPKNDLNTIMNDPKGLKQHLIPLPHLIGLMLFLSPLWSSRYDVR